MPQLTIPDDIYERLARRAASLNVTIEQLLAPILEQAAAAGATNGSQPAPPSDLPFDQWKAQFDKMLALVHSRADRYPPGFQADVSRESIYEGCGE